MQKEWISLAEETDSFRFVKLADNLSFAESSASHSGFDILRGDGKQNIYFPVNNDEKNLLIYSIDIKSQATNADFVSQVKTSDIDKLTCYGSELSSKGILWMAIFDHNLILGYDLKKNVVVHQFENIPCPNDLSVCALDEDIIYVAGGRGVTSKEQYIIPYKNKI